MKRVVIDINSVLPYYSRGWVSGIGRTTMELVHALAREKELPFEVALYSQNTLGVTGARMELPFLNKHLPYPHRRNWNKVLGILPVRELVTGYDLIHIPHNFEYVFLPSRTILTIHDTLYFSHPEKSLSHDFSRRHIPSLAKKCRGIITCSESSKRDIMHYMDIPEEKISVTPWGVNRELFHPEEIATDYPYFLSVSCSTGRKNTPILIEAYQQFAKQDPSHHLVLVWGNAPAEIRTLCEKTPTIHLLNNLSNEELAKLYQGATATFFLSRYEGFGLPILESFACATPVVTCNNSSLAEIGGEAAHYVHPDDINGCVREMEFFENNVGNLASLKEQSLQQSKAFAWDSCAKRTIKVYEKYIR